MTGAAERKEATNRARVAHQITASIVTAAAAAAPFTRPGDVYSVRSMYISYNNNNNPAATKRAPHRSCCICTSSAIGRSARHGGEEAFLLLLHTLGLISAKGGAKPHPSGAQDWPWCRLAAPISWTPTSLLEPFATTPIPRSTAAIASPLLVTSLPLQPRLHAELTACQACWARPPPFLYPDIAS